MIVERKGRMWRLQQWNVFLMCLFLLLKRSIWDLLSQNERQWPLIIPAWPLNPAMHYTLVWVFVYQIWWSQGILKIFDLWLTPALPLHHFWPQKWITRWSGVLSTIFGGLKAVLIWPLVDPGCPLHGLWPQQYITLINTRAPAAAYDSYMTFDPCSCIKLCNINYI